MSDNTIFDTSTRESKIYTKTIHNDKVPDYFTGKELKRKVKGVEQTVFVQRNVMYAAHVDKELWEYVYEEIIEVI